MRHQQFRLCKLLRKAPKGGWLATTDDGQIGFLPEHELTVIRREGFEEDSLPGLVIELSLEGSSFLRLSRVTVLVSLAESEIGRELTAKIHTVAGGTAFASVGAGFNGALGNRDRTFAIGDEVAVAIDSFSKKHMSFQLRLLNENDRTKLRLLKGYEQPDLVEQNTAIKPVVSKPTNQPFLGLKELLAR